MKLTSRSLDDLTPEMRAKTQLVINGCADRGVDILVTCTLRSLADQSRLYCSCHDNKTVAAKVKWLTGIGLEKIASDIEVINRTLDDTLDKGLITNAAGGESFHQYGMAVDCVPVVNGKPIWDATKLQWQIYGSEARNAGLYWSGDWKRFIELPHIQLLKQGNPLDVFGPEKALKMLSDGGML